MRDAVQKSFLFPRGFAGGGVGDDGGFGRATAETFDDPDDFHVHQIGVEDARDCDAVHEQRLGLVHVETVDDAILLGIQTRANRFGEVGMI